MAGSQGIEDPAAAAAPEQGDADEQRQPGFRTARFVLACFAGEAETLAHPLAKGPPPAGLRPGTIRENAPATGLHPHGTHAPAARRVLVYMFSRQLVELSRRAG